MGMADQKKWTFEFTSNVPQVKALKDSAVKRALEKMGGKAETYAKKLCPVKTGNLRGSITHVPSKTEENTELVGTDVTYAPYVELGHAQEPGRYVPAIGKRLVASFVQGKPFIRPAIEDHTSEYRQIAENELKKA